MGESELKEEEKKKERRRKNGSMAKYCWRYKNRTMVSSCMVSSDSGSQKFILL